MPDTIFGNYRITYGSSGINSINYYFHSLVLSFLILSKYVQVKNWVKSLAIYFKSIHFILVFLGQSSFGSFLCHGCLYLVRWSVTVMNITFDRCPGVTGSEGLILGLDYSIGNKSLNWQLMCARPFLGQ